MSYHRNNLEAQNVTVRQVWYDRNMKAKITARWWNEDLQKKFGESGSVHNLPLDTETFMKEIVIPFGRFEVIPGGDTLKIEFQNDYD